MEGMLLHELRPTQGSRQPHATTRVGVSVPRPWPTVTPVAPSSPWPVVTPLLRTPLPTPLPLPSPLPTPFQHHYRSRHRPQHCRRPGTATSTRTALPPPPPCPSAGPAATIRGWVPPAAGTPNALRCRALSCYFRVLRGQS